MNQLTFILKIGLLCAFMVMMGTLAKRQFDRAAGMEADNAKQERHLGVIKHENQDLGTRARALSKEAGIEREARRLGYVRQGEMHLQIAPPAQN